MNQLCSLLVSRTALLGLVLFFFLCKWLYSMKLWIVCIYELEYKRAAIFTGKTAIIKITSTGPHGTYLQKTIGFMMEQTPAAALQITWRLWWINNKKMGLCVRCRGWKEMNLWSSSSEHQIVYLTNENPNWRSYFSCTYRQHLFYETM